MKSKAASLVGAGKHELIHQTLCTGIGEQVDIYFNPPLFMTFPETPFWYVLGEGSIDSATGSGTTLTAHLSPGSATVKVVVRDVTLSVPFDVIAPNGIEVVYYTNNYEGWLPGTAEIGANTKYLLNVLPTMVSFIKMKSRENKPAHSIVWPDGSTNSWDTAFEPVDPGDCGYMFVDDISDGLYSKYKLFNGTIFTNCSFYYSWHDEYLNQSGEWIPYTSVNTLTQFKGSDLTGQETYQGVSGDPIGPFQ